MSNEIIITLNSLIIGSLVLFSPLLFCFIFSFFINKVNKNFSIYVYSFITGLMIIMSTFGLIREGYDHMHEHTHDEWLIIVVITLGVIIGLMLTVLLRYIVIIKSKKEIHHDHNHHNHSDILYNISDIENKNSFWMILSSLMGHKIIAGISLGLLIYNSSSEIMSFNHLGLILISILHMIPESFILFYKSYEITKSKIKSLLITALSQIVIIIFMIIGAFAFYKIEDIAYWLMPILFAISGSSVLFVSIFDLVPEFIHNKNLSSKKWFSVILVFCLGIVISVVLSMIHKH